MIISNLRVKHFNFLEWVVYYLYFWKFFLMLLVFFSILLWCTNTKFPFNITLHYICYILINAKADNAVYNENCLES